MFKKGQKGRIFTLKIHCAKCDTYLYKYQKEGRGSLVKCYKDRIIEDRTKINLRCPKCNTLFAKEIKIRNRLANKIIKGKIYIKGHIKK